MIIGCCVVCCCPSIQEHKLVLQLIVAAIKESNIAIVCTLFPLQVEVDWEKINAKIDMELKKEAAKPGAKPYNG